MHLRATARAHKNRATRNIAPLLGYIVSIYLDERAKPYIGGIKNVDCPRAAGIQSNINA